MPGGVDGWASGSELNATELREAVVPSHEVDPWSPTEERMKELFPPDGEPPADMPESVRDDIIEAGPGSKAWQAWYGGARPGGAGAD